MATTSICLLMFSILMHFANISAYDSSIVSDLVQHIQRLDAKIIQLEVKYRDEVNARMTKLENKHRDEIKDLRKQINLREKECDMKIEEVFSRVVDLERRNVVMDDGEDYKYDDRIPEPSAGASTEKNSSKKIDSSSSILVTNIVGKMKAGDKTTADETEVVHTQTKSANHRRGSTGLNLAFSTYMDHSVELGPGQPLIFNQILLNDGDAYNTHTGIFTAPVGGVYSFSFFIGERFSNNEWVSLSVNSESKINAAADSYHTYQDLQGGNTVNLKMVTGDVVYVKNKGSGDNHVEGSSSLRLTTFSGFLIYPVY